MLPHAKDPPARRDEGSIRLSVASNVGFDLRHPEATVGTRPHEMVGTTVPEAAVHEYGDLRWPVNDVSRPTESDQGPDVYSVS